MRVDAVKRARAALGAPFRLHGRDPRYGLDCVGLAVHAYRSVERPPTGYELRGGHRAGWERLLRDMHCRRRRVRPKPGDLFLMAPGPAQFHLGVWSGDSLIHADAGLRRIVETPGWPRWPLLSVWIPKRARV